jgi:putative membrane protein
MQAVLDTLLSGFPYFISHFGLTILMLGCGIYIYEKITPYKELELVRQGNTAAAISLAAAVLGLAIPLASCLEGSVSLWDIFIWGWVILIIQILAFYLANLIIDDLKGRIERDEIGPAILLFAGKISIALINAAAISDKI